MSVSHESSSPPPIPPMADRGNRRRSRPKQYFPSRNPDALAGYYLGVGSIIPVLGLPLAIPALLRGLDGLRAVQADATVQGGGHAWVGVGFGGLSLGVHLGVGLAYVMWTNVS